MKLDILDKNGKKIEDITLEKEVFGAKANSALVTQYLHVYHTNQRQGTVSTKTRAEVSGGGKKPWRQKGTGRARHGSIRSPLWVHGGVSHGPKPRNWSLSLPKKMRNGAMVSVLSLKYADSLIKGVELLDLKEVKSKNITDLLKNLSLSGKTLFVLAKGNKNVLLSARNLPSVTVAEVSNVNVYDLISTSNIVFEKAAVAILQKRLK